jgi:hypothetical protein
MYFVHAMASQPHDQQVDNDASESISMALRLITKSG